LSIVPGQHCWLLFIDALVLDSDGNLFDALSLACRAALGNTRIPRLTVLQDAGSVDIQLSDDITEFDTLDITHVPVNVTLTKIGHEFLVDPSLEEELCQSARLTVGVNAKGHTVAIQKGGRGGLLPTSIHAMLFTARKLGVSMIAALDQSLAQQAEQHRLHPSAAASESIFLS
jgi:exosome complex component RRP42